MADPFASIDNAIASTPPPAAAPTAQPAADPFAAIDEHLPGRVEKTEVPAQASEPAQPAVTTPAPEPTQQAPPTMAYDGPAPLPMNGAPGMKPFESVGDIHNEGLMHPQMKPPAPLQSGYAAEAYGPQERGRAPQYGEGIRDGKGNVPVWQNTMKDLGDMGEGIGRVMNMGLERGIEAMPEELNSIGIPGQGKPLFGKVSKDGLADPDVQTLGAVGRGMTDYYNDRYIQPFNPAAGGGPIEGVNAIRQQVFAHPTSVVDIAGGGMMNAAGGARALTGGVGRQFAKVAAGTGRVAAGARKLQQAGTDLYQGINAAPKESTLPVKLLRDIPKNYASKLLLQTPMQIAWQTLQNATTFALTQLNSPKDLLYGGVGMMMAAGKAKRWVPPEFFTGEPQLLAQMPKWITYLAAPDTLMNKHLELIGRQDNYWRAASALTMATREAMNVSSPQQFKLMADMLHLSFTAQKNIKKLFNDPQASQKFLREVHRTMGNYDKQFGALENAINKNVLFYRAIRHLFILSSSFPFHHPVKTSAIHALSTVMVKMAESEPMNARIKAAGGVLVRDKNGQLVLGPNGTPMVFTKAGGLTPFLTGISDMQFIAKMLNRDGMGDVEMVASAAPFIEIAFGAAGYDLGKGGKAYKDPDSVSPDSGKTQIKGWKVQKAMSGDYEIQPGDYQEHPARPWEALIGDSLAPGIYNSILKYQAQVQEVPGVPSDFSTIGHPVNRRNGLTGEVTKPMPMTPGSMFFNKLQPNEMGIDTEAEQSMNESREKKTMKKFARSSMNRDDWGL